MPGVTENPTPPAVRGLDADQAAAEVPAKPAAPRSRRGASTTFASLAYRNYRLWFIGQAASLIGTWMQTTAQAFLIYQLTGSPAYLGLVGFATGVPIWLFSLYGGVISDRVSRRNMMLWTQTSMMALAFVLAGLTFTGLVQPWQIVVLSFLTGVANAFDAPARQAFVVELVERPDLPNAIALNSTMVNLGSAIGPAAAGLVYALLGAAWCFTINGISFLAVIAALLMLRLAAQPARPRHSSALVDLKAGLGYVAGHRVILMLMATVTVATVFGISAMTLLPAWSVEVLNGNAATNGFLTSARGLGSLIGALTIATLGNIRFKGRVFTLGTIAFPLALLAWAAVRWIPLSLFLMVCAGWGSMLIFNMANILVQSHVSDHLRGRVMGVYTLSFFGMMPIGALLAGAMAQAIGEPLTVALGAAVTLGFAGWLWLRRPEMRALE